MSVSVPSRSGKTDLIFQMLFKGTFYPSYNKIFYFYPYDQPKYRSFVFHNKFDIEFIKLSSFEIVNNLRDYMIAMNDCFDDTCEEIFNEKDFVKLAQQADTKMFMLFMSSTIYFSKVNNHVQ